MRLGLEPRASCMPGMHISNWVPGLFSMAFGETFQHISFYSVKWFLTTVVINWYLYTTLITFFNDSDKKKHQNIRCDTWHENHALIQLVIFFFKHNQLSFSHRGRTHHLPKARNPCPSWLKFQLNFITTSRLYIFTGQCKSLLMPGNALYGPPLSQSISLREDLVYISK